MSTNDRRRPTAVPTSAPPEPSPIDATWDDETVPGLNLDDPLNEFDRVTAIPELPPELYAKKIMASVEDSRVPDPSSEPPARPAHQQETTPFSLDSQPPPGERSPDSTLRHPTSAQSAPTARPAAPPKPGQKSAVADEARAPAALAPSPTGLELADLNFDSISDLHVAPIHDARAKGRDPRDPVLELELELEGLPSRTQTSEPEDPALTEMKDRYAMGDFTGALVIADGILEANPDDLDAPRYAQSCRDVLIQMYSARLGALDQVVRMVLPSDQIRWLTLDHRAGFLLSLIDGGSTVDQILDISGMPRLDALRIMYQLLDQRVISLGL